MSFTSVDEQDYPRITPAVRWLIAINVAIYFVQLTLTGPANMQRALAFQLTDLTTRPWTIFTYMFVHAGFWHLALNMWMLWVFGPRVEHMWNARSFSFYYILCGLGGWLFHLMVAGDASYLLGALAAIYGVLLAYAMQWPDDEVRFFPFVFIAMKVRWYVVLLIGLSLAQGVWSAGSGSGIAYMAHLGGLFVGYLYLRFSAAHGIERLRSRVSQAPDIPDEPPRAIPRTHPRTRERVNEVDEIVARSNAVIAKQQQQQAAVPSLANKVGKQKSEELNHVLDKISQRGMESLTGEERRLLDELSRKLRDR